MLIEKFNELTGAKINPSCSQAKFEVLSLIKNSKALSGNEQIQEIRLKLWESLSEKQKIESRLLSFCDSKLIMGPEIASLGLNFYNLNKKQLSKLDLLLAEVGY